MTTSTSAPAGGLVLPAITPTDEPAARTTASGSGPSLNTVKWRFSRFDMESLAVNTHPRAVPRGEYALRRLVMKGRAFEKERTP